MQDQGHNIEEAAKVVCECERRSAECARGILAVRSDGQAGIAIVGPNSLMLAEMFFEGALICDFYFN